MTLAAESVIGTLDRATAARAAAALAADPALAAEAAAWAARLAPLAGLAPLEPPPPDLWDRIEARIVPPANPYSRRRGRRLWAWRAWAVMMTLALIAVGVARLFGGPPPRLMSVLSGDRNAAMLLLTPRPGGRLALVAMPAPTGIRFAAPSGRVVELWGLPPGSHKPVRLGVLPHTPGALTVLPDSGVTLPAGTLIEATLEPEGGAPLGVPTGAVVLYGRLLTAPPF